MANTAGFYALIERGQQSFGQTVALLSETIRRRLVVEIVDDTIVDSAEITEGSRPISLTYIIRVTGLNAAAVNEGPEVPIEPDGATVHANFAGTGLSIVFKAGIVPGQQSEVEVRGDIQYPRPFTNEVYQNENRLLIESDRTLARLELLRWIHLYWFLFDFEAEAILAGLPAPARVNTVEHIVAEYEGDWATIAKRYGVPWQTIIQFNRLKPSDLRPGLSLLIPVGTDEQRIVPNLFVLGPHSGRLAWGVDLDNGLRIADGAYKTLNYTQTLGKNLCNIVRAVSWGEIDRELFSEEEAASAIYQQRLITAILNDARFINVVIDSFKIEQSAVYCDLRVYPINQQPFQLMVSENDGKVEISCYDMATARAVQPAPLDLGDNEPVVTVNDQVIITPSPAIVPTVDIADLLGYWKLETNGNDSTVRANHGSVSGGGATFGSNRLNTDGVDYFTIPYHVDYANYEEYTFEITVRILTPAALAFRLIASTTMDANYAVTDAPLILAYNATAFRQYDELRFYTALDSLERPIFPYVARQYFQNAAVTGDEVTISVVRKAKLFRLYMNGQVAVQPGEGRMGGDPKTTNSSAIFLGQRWLGSLRECRLWGRALSDAEIAARWNISLI